MWIGRLLYIQHGRASLLVVCADACVLQEVQFFLHKSHLCSSVQLIELHPDEASTSADQAILAAWGWQEMKRH